jgi:hypothetical protein
MCSVGCFIHRIAVRGRADQQYIYVGGWWSIDAVVSSGPGPVDQYPVYALKIAELLRDDRMRAEGGDEQFREWFAQAMIHVGAKQPCSAHTAFRDKSGRGKPGDFVVDS